jgi:hypothetical protein
VIALHARRSADLPWMPTARIEFVLLTGPSGSGKSTILRQISTDFSCDAVTLVAQDAPRGPSMVRCAGMLKAGYVGKAQAPVAGARPSAATA